MFACVCMCACTHMGFCPYVCLYVCCVSVFVHVTVSICLCVNECFCVCVSVCLFVHVAKSHSAKVQLKEQPARTGSVLHHVDLWDKN